MACIIVESVSVGSLYSSAAMRQRGSNEHQQARVESHAPERKKERKIMQHDTTREDVLCCLKRKVCALRANATFINQTNQKKTRTHSVSLSLSLSLSHSHSLTLSLSHSLTHSLTLSLSLSVSHTHSLCLCVLRKHTQKQEQWVLLLRSRHRLVLLPRD